MREMKDSGTNWLGCIPSCWTLGRIGQIYSERRIKVSDTEYQPLSVTMQGIVPQLSTAAKTDAHDDRKLVRTGDFAINSRSDRRGSCGISPYDGSVSLINTILAPKGKMNPHYYNWLFHTSEFASEFYKWGHGIVDDLWTTNWGDMKKISIPVPTLSEQQRIASFLDRKCAIIDNILEKTRTSIEEYKKLKQAVITEAVTKGVRGERQVKDSGIEWIGPYVAKWGLVKLKLITSKIGSGYTPKGGAEIYTNEGVKFIRSQNVYFEGFKLDEVAYITPEIDEEMKGTRVHENDILFNITGGSIGRCRYVDANFGKANVNQHVCIVRPSGVNTKFLFYYLQSEKGQVQVSIFQTGGNREGLSASAFGEFRITLPSAEEQKEIVAYLDAKCAEIDNLISSKEKFITELESYKKSLIYEYVTGKKEVPSNP